MNKFIFHGIRRALFLGAHPDDEMGCSGLLARLIENETEVHYHVFSGCEQSVPKGLPQDILRSEVIAAGMAIGISAANIHVGNFRVRYFPTDRQDILEEMVVLNKTIDPDLVLVPASDDRHQDHAVVSQEAFRGFKNKTILGYELPLNSKAFEHQLFVELQEPHLQKKIDCMNAYGSQQFRHYMRDETLRALAVVRGMQIGVHYAEAFEVIRMVIRSD